MIYNLEWMEYYADLSKLLANVCAVLDAVDGSCRAVRRRGLVYIAKRQGLGQILEMTIRFARMHS